uniref:RING-type E3 ubiquitin transferase (cysteine targeting) n=1 Tax=Lactuca sativa TaxID=4236 RepID=A0A9R1WM55_LACSA|nr:hypothetical protein LSAT_V11C100034330 [Lactuca sativa]
MFLIIISIGSRTWVDEPTPGNVLMNLQYRDERTMETRAKLRTGLEGPGLTVYQKIWYCVATVGGQYISALICNPFLLSPSGYRNLIERAIKARLVIGSPHMNRAISFKYMNCQLVWKEFLEMLSLLLPLLNSCSMKNFLRLLSKDNSSGSARI